MCDSRRDARQASSEKGARPFVPAAEPYTLQICRRPTSYTRRILSPKRVLMCAHQPNFEAFLRCPSHITQGAHLCDLLSGQRLDDINRTWRLHPSTVVVLQRHLHIRLAAKASKSWTSRQMAPRSQKRRPEVLVLGFHSSIQCFHLALEVADVQVEPFAGYNIVQQLSITGNDRTD